MDLLIIRHGQSEADILGVIEGRADFDLTELGYRQAKLMAEWTSQKYNITKIISSPLKRARKTAEALSLSINIPVEFDDCLMEWNNGLIAGLTQKDADEKYPLPDKKYPHTAIYGQESMINFRARAETALSRIINENPPDSKIAVISHGGMINMLFRSFLGLPLNSAVTVSSGDTSIHHWRVEGNSKRVILMNSDTHLM